MSSSRPWDDRCRLCAARRRESLVCARRSTRFQGDVSLSDVLIAAKLLWKDETDRAPFPALRRTRGLRNRRKRWSGDVEELQSVRLSLNE
jgi:hypothetical protein